MIDGVRTSGAAMHGRRKDKEAEQRLASRQQVRRRVEQQLEFQAIMEAVMHDATHQAKDGSLYRFSVLNGKEWWAKWRNDVMDWQPISGKPSFEVVEL